MQHVISSRKSNFAICSPRKIGLLFEERNILYCSPPSSSPPPSASPWRRVCLVSPGKNNQQQSLDNALIIRSQPRSSKSASAATKVERPKTRWVGGSQLISRTRTPTKTIPKNVQPHHFLLYSLLPPLLLLLAPHLLYYHHHHL